MSHLLNTGQMSQIFTITVVVQQYLWKTKTNQMWQVHHHKIILHCFHYLSKPHHTIYQNQQCMSHAQSLGLYSKSHLNFQQTIQSCLISDISLPCALMFESQSDTVDGIRMSYDQVKAMLMVHDSSQAHDTHMYIIEGISNLKID